MTSRNSSSNISMIFATMRRNTWLLVMAIVGFIFAGPVASAISVQRKSKIISENANPDMLNINLQSQASGLLEAFHVCSTIIVAIGAVLAALVLFNYLTNHKKTDLFHSIPVSRERLFAINYLAGFFIFLLPFILGFILNALAVAALGYAGYFTWGLYFFYALKLIIGFFCLYSITVMAMALCGTTIMSLMITAAINAFFPVLLTLSQSLKMYFYETYYTNIDIVSLWAQRTSPVINMFGEVTWLNILILAVIGAAALIFAVLLYKKRRSEAAGSSLAFRRSKHIVKIPIALVGTLAFATIFYNISNNVTAWLYFGGIAGAILICQCLEIWIEGEFAAVKKGWLSVVIVAVICTGIFTYIDYDLGGYDKYLPEAEDIASVQLEMSNVDSYLNNTEINRPYTANSDDEGISVPVKDSVTLTDAKTIQAAASIAAYGIDHLNGYTMYQQNYEEPMAAETEDTKVMDYSSADTATVATSGYDLTDVSVIYKLKNGKTVRRTYTGLDIGDIRDSLLTVLSDQTYRAEYAMLLGVDAKQVAVREISNFKSHSVYGKQIPDETHAKLAASYLQEYKKLTAQTMMEEIPIGYISLLSFNDPDNMPESIKDALSKYNGDILTDFPYFACNYPIYPSFTETVSLIKGLYGDDFFDADLANINNIEISYMLDMNESAKDDEDNNSNLERLMKKNYESDSNLADLMTFEEFRNNYTEDNCLVVHNPQIIERIMAASCDADVTTYTPFIKTENSKSYTVNYNNGISVSRIQLAQ